MFNLMFGQVGLEIFGFEGRCLIRFDRFWEAVFVNDFIQEFDYRFGFASFRSLRPQPIAVIIYGDEHMSL